MPDAPQPLRPGGNQVTIGTPGTIVIPPRVFRVRLTGLLFDTDKTFLLPGALKSIRAFKKIWAAHPDIHVLVVGHADRAGSPDHNQKLSERRAEAIRAYLTDDVDAWIAFYPPGVSPTLPWGAVEDQHMAAHLGFASAAAFAAARGTSGTATRRALVTEYMAEDQTKKPDATELQIHGCGESHPEIPTADGVSEQRNRRVEVFLFEQAIDPAPVNPCAPQPLGCQEYKSWKGAARETVDLGDDLGAVSVTVTDQNGAPVPDADIHLSGFVPEDARTDAAGAARIADVLPLEYEVFARKQGFTSASAKIVVPAGGDVPVALTIVAATGTLDVVVRDGGGAPLPGAAVTATLAGGGAPANGTSDAAGLVRFTPLASGSYALTANAAGFVPATGTAAVNPDQTTTQVLTLAALVSSLAVSVVDGGGAPVAGASVTVLDAAGATVATGTSDAAGKATFTLKPGTFTVRAHKDGFLDGTTSAPVSGPSTATVTLQRVLLGELDANFDRKTGTFTSVASAARRAARLVRPGAILLPNVDIDATGKPRTRQRVDELDSLDAVPNALDDPSELTEMHVREPAGFTGGTAGKITLRVHAADAERIRIWRVPDGGGALTAANVVIGPGVGNEHVVVDASKAAPARGWDVKFFVEALHPAGAPPLLRAPQPPAPEVLAPEPPGPLQTPAPTAAGGSESAPKINLTDLTKSIYPGDKRFELVGSNKKSDVRAAHDVWMELVHDVGGTEIREARDVALFTIAPWLMSWNTLPIKRLYVSSIRASVRPTTFDEALKENHSTLFELQRPCLVAGIGKLFDGDTRNEIVPHDPRNSTSPTDPGYWIVGLADDPANGIFGNGGDGFIQDQFEVGSCLAPHASLHVGLHAYRLATLVIAPNLAAWFANHFASPGLGAFDHMAQARFDRGVLTETNVPPDPGGDDSVEGGGNLEIAPPVAAKTPAIAADAAGPSVPAHRAAPLGKILLGDCDARPVRKQLRRFLLSQNVQPVLPIDTSWLAVGHVDEMLSFVPSDRGGKAFRAMFADGGVMARILMEAANAEDRASLHAGHYGAASLDPSAPLVYQEVIADDLFFNAFPTSLSISSASLRAIRARLKTGLALDDDDFLPMPVFFKPVDLLGRKRALALTVDVVNSTVMGKVVCVPRPSGPRLPRALAATAVANVLAATFPKDTPAVSLPDPDEEHFFWARPRESLTAIAMYFARQATFRGFTNQLSLGHKQRMIKHIEEVRAAGFAPTAFDIDNKVGKLAAMAVGQMVQELLKHPKNQGQQTVPPFPGADSLFMNLTSVSAGGKTDKVVTEWLRLFIPDGTVDVTEGYVKSVLEHHGCIVEFIDCFEAYHQKEGEIHCGTNAIRAAPDAGAGITTRWFDPGVYDPGQDASYVTRPLFL
jgi:outer membrane protein OmpA-like peptidoglycan-associated protein